MMVARAAASVLVLVLVSILGALPAARAQDETHRMRSAATYVVDPAGRTVDVNVEIEFTNTTPDPPGQFSVFEVIDLAIHDAAEQVTAHDEQGDLEVVTEVREAEGGDVNVASVGLRDPLRHEETATFVLTYQLPDGADGGLRVGPSLVIFPAWSFGSATGEVAATVSIELPAAFEVRTDGDAIEASRDGDLTRLESAPISDTTGWLVLITAYRLGEYVKIEHSIPLASGTVDLRIRAFEEDAAWGERIGDLLTSALPRLEEVIGLPYERAGPLVVVESPPVGFGPLVEQATDGGEILIAHDAPPFTVVHQVSHVWLNPRLFAERWIHEGLASHYPAQVAPELDIEPPYEPEARAQDLAEAAIPLSEWRETEAPGTPERDGYAYAASWMVIDRVATAIGEEALRAAVGRVAAGIDAYDPRALDAAPPSLFTPAGPADGREFLDQLEVGGADLSDLFAELVFDQDTVAQLADRTRARDDFGELRAQAADWDTPRSIAELMSAWRFEEARRAIAEASAWLAERDAVFEVISAAGLSVPTRLRDVYQRDGGGPEAQAELAAVDAVAVEYRQALDEVSAERSLLTRLGLAGGSEPGSLLARGNRLFGDGQLHEATDAIVETRAVMAAAEMTGLLRVLAAVVVVIVLVAGIFLIVRRRRGAATAGR